VPLSTTLPRLRPGSSYADFDPSCGIGRLDLRRLPIANRMKTRTHLFTFPIETASERTEVEAALDKLSAELELTHPLRLKGGHRGLVTVPDVEPEDTWSAMDRVVPEWQRLFLPRSSF
jgi:hypothetical protein